MQEKANKIEVQEAITIEIQEAQVEVEAQEEVEQWFEQAIQEKAEAVVTV